MQTANISWLWKKSAKRKHIALHIDDSGELEVRTPLRTSVKKVEALILEKRQWIERSSIKQLERIHPRLPSFAPQGIIIFLGESYTFYVESGSRSSLNIVGSDIFIQTKSEQTFVKLLKNWYAKQTQALVEASLLELSSQLKKPYAEVGYRYYKRRWGSCDTYNNLMFNTLLSSHKKEYVHYVVAHELAHIKEKNHSPAFYTEGERILKGFKSLHKQMRD